jgi:transcriptional regulator of acetoin/glycerol metabolism
VKSLAPNVPARHEWWNYRLAKESVLESFNRRFLLELTRETRGNVTMAARASGKDRSDFGRLLRKYEIAVQSFRLSA